MNTRIDKLKLLEEIQSGKIKPEDVPSDPLIISTVKDMFIGMMIACSEEYRDANCPVVYVGEARKALDEFLERIKEKRLNRLIK